MTPASGLILVTASSEEIGQVVMDRFIGAATVARERADKCRQHEELASRGGECFHTDSVHPGASDGTPA